MPPPRRHRGVIRNRDDAARERSGDDRQTRIDRNRQVGRLRQMRAGCGIGDRDGGGGCARGCRAAGDGAAGADGEPGRQTGCGERIGRVPPVAVTVVE